MTGRPRILPGWVPKRAGGTKLVNSYIWQTPSTWESIRVLSEEERAAGKFLVLDWDGAIHAETERAALLAFPGTARNASPWVPLSGLRMHQHAPGARPLFLAAAYLASSGPLFPRLAGAENGGQQEPTG